MLFELGQVYNSSQETPNSGLPKDEICERGELGPNYGAGVMTSGVITQLPIWLSPEVAIQREDVFNGKVGLYVVGCIDYSDAASKASYRTNMRFVFNPRDTEPFSMTRFGNEAR